MSKVTGASRLWNTTGDKIKLCKSSTISVTQFPFNAISVAQFAYSAIVQVAQYAYSRVARNSCSHPKWTSIPVLVKEPVHNYLSSSTFSDTLSSSKMVSHYVVKSSYILANGLVFSQQVII